MAARMNQIFEFDERHVVMIANNEIDLTTLWQKLDSWAFGEKCALEEKPEDRLVKVVNRYAL